MINNGAFVEVDLAMMVHPFPENVLMPVANGFAQRTIAYTGKAAHEPDCCQCRDSQSHTCTDVPTDSKLLDYIKEL